MSKVFNALLSGELTQDINVAVGAFVGSEDVMIWDQDDLSGSQTLASVPNSLEHTDSAGTTDIMSHQQVNINILPIYHRPTGGSRFFGEGHAHSDRVPLSSTSYKIYIKHFCLPLKKC